MIPCVLIRARVVDAPHLDVVYIKLGYRLGLILCNPKWTKGLNVRLEISMSMSLQTKSYIVFSYKIWGVDII